jgi:hypothetical protein
VKLTHNTCTNKEKRNKKKGSKPDQEALNGYSPVANLSIPEKGTIHVKRRKEIGLLDQNGQDGKGNRRWMHA